MPQLDGINISALVAPDAMVEFLDSTKLPEFSGNIGEDQWNQKTYALGRTIEIPKQNFMTASQGMVSNSSTLTEDLITLTVQEPINISYDYDSYDQLLTVGGPKNDPKISMGFKQRILTPMMMGIRAKLETLMMAELERNYYMTAGTAGTPLSAVSNLGPLTSLITRMELEPHTWAMITSPEQYASMGSGIVSTASFFDQQYVDPILKELNIPKVFGFGLMKSNYVNTHVYGTAAALDTLTVLTTMTPGQNTIVLTGATPGRTIKAGDKFSIGSVYYVTPTGKVAFGQLMGFTAFNDAIADGSGHISVTLSIPYWDATNERQNVTALPQAGASVTFKGHTTGGVYQHTSNFVIFRDSLTLSSLRMPAIKGAECAWEMDSKSQMIVRVTNQGVAKTSVNTLRIDIAPVFGAFPDYGIAYLT